jgi:hypothetical protein
VLYIRVKDVMAMHRMDLMSACVQLKINPNFPTDKNETGWWIVHPNIWKRAPIATHLTSINAHHARARFGGQPLEDGGQVGKMNGGMPGRALCTCRLTMPLEARGRAKQVELCLHTSSNSASRGRCRHLKSPRIHISETDEGPGVVPEDDI